MSPVSVRFSPPGEPRLPLATRYRRLLAVETRVFMGEYGQMYCEIEGEQTYRSVFALRLFPVRHPDLYIELFYTNEKEKILEIGVIEDLRDFPLEAQKLIQVSLANQYNEPLVTRIYAIKEKFGLLFYDMETQRGREAMIQPWRHDRAEEFGENGKVLLDAYDNRFILHDIDRLPAMDKRVFTRYIYW